ncbi:MAG TPA: hypothetical protein VHO25_06285 [Polyangiaceae bacterium]|nr:hypothetical protein [Polyangiaceae bacterium]
MSEEQQQEAPPKRTRKAKRKPRKSSALVVASEGQAATALAQADTNNSVKVTRARDKISKRSKPGPVPSVQAQVAQLEKVLETEIPNVFLAAASLGIPRTTLSDWLSKARGGDDDYAGLLERIQIARDKGAGTMLKALRTHKDLRPETVLQLMERLFPEEFGAKVAVVLQTERASMLDAFDAAVAAILTGELAAHGQRLRADFYARLATGAES